jgi:hypothetical protein
VLGPIFSRPSHFSPPRQPTAPCRSHHPVGPTCQQPQPVSARVYPCHGHMGPRWQPLAVRTVEHTGVRGSLTDGVALPASSPLPERIRALFASRSSLPRSPRWHRSQVVYPPTPTTFPRCVAVSLQVGPHQQPAARRYFKLPCSTVIAAADSGSHWNNPLSSRPDPGGDKYRLTSPLSSHLFCATHKH